MAENFRNILEDLNTANDFFWVSRVIHFIKAYNQDRWVSPSQLKTIVSKSGRLQDILKSSSPKVSNGKISSTNNCILEILEEIGYAYDLSVIRWLGLFLIKLLRKSLSGLYVNERKLSLITYEMGSSPVIFVPTHRSYGDFILMAFICFKYNIHIPCVAAGKDFLSMRLMNKVLRKSKAFFMRRKFVDDPVYRFVFQEYIKAMISFEESPIEFFIEGTRSRTGKSLPPKFGFLTMVIEAYLCGDIPDLTIVPINISYDRLLEETLFAYELLGIPKPKESTKGFFKALRVLDEKYGKVHINFGDPFSIRSFFDDKIDFRYRCPEKESQKIREIAFKIIEKQQSLQVYGVFNLLAFVLYDFILRTHTYAISLNEAIANINEILFIFEVYGANVHIDGDLETSIKQAITVHRTLVTLSSDNMIILKEEEPNWEMNQIKNKKGCNLDEGIIQKGVPLIMLQIYVNPSLTLLVRSSIIITILNTYIKELEVTIDLLYQNYQYVCDIFKHEFVLNNSDFQEFTDSLFRLEHLEIIELHNGIIKIKKCSNLSHYFINLLKPFLISACEFCNFLSEFQEEISKGNQQQIIKNAQYYISLKIMSGDIQEYYCLSLDLISNLCNSLIDAKVIGRGRRKNKLFINEKLLNDLTRYLSCLLNGRMNQLQNNNLSYLCNNTIKSKL